MFFHFCFAMNTIIKFISVKQGSISQIEYVYVQLIINMNYVTIILVIPTKYKN